MTNGTMEPTFAEVLADTGTDYQGIVSRPKWKAPEFDTDAAWADVERRFADEQWDEPAPKPPKPPKTVAKKAPAKKSTPKRGPGGKFQP